MVIKIRRPYCTNKHSSVARVVPSIHEFLVEAMYTLGMFAMYVEQCVSVWPRSPHLLTNGDFLYDFEVLTICLDSGLHQIGSL